MIRALIFDFNGVLADDDPIHMHALQQVALEEGLSISHDEYLDKYLPLNDWDSFKTLFADNARPLPSAKLDDLIQRKSIYYFRAIAEKAVLFDGAAEAVQRAAERMPVAIASGARRQEIQHILDLAGIRSLFGTIVAAEDVRYGKPHPEPFLTAHKRLQDLDETLTAAHCVAVEDSIGGIRSAHEAGMRCVGVAHSYDEGRLKTAKPEWIIHSIKDFASWFDRTVSH